MTSSSSSPASGGVDTTGITGTYVGATYPPASGNWVYPFDKTGTAVTNKVTNELQTVAPNEAADYHFIIPFAAPFFRESMTLHNNTNNTYLVEGVDFLFSHKFMDASESIGVPIYGSITLLNRSLNALIRLDYQTLGGAWTINEQQLAVLLAETRYNPLITTWDEIQDLPYQFPPINHNWNLADLKGLDSVVDSIWGLSSAITGGYLTNELLVQQPGNYIVGGSEFDIATGDLMNFYVVPLTGGTCDITIDTPIVGIGQVRAIELVLQQTVAGSLVSWPSSITWATGSTGNTNAPALSTDVNSFDVIRLIYSQDAGWLGYIIS